MLVSEYPNFIGWLLEIWCVQRLTAKRNHTARCFIYHSLGTVLDLGDEGGIGMVGKYNFGTLEKVVGVEVDSSWFLLFYHSLGIGLSEIGMGGNLRDIGKRG